MSFPKKPGFEIFQPVWARFKDQLLWIVYIKQKLKFNGRPHIKF